MQEQKMFFNCFLQEHSAAPASFGASLLLKKVLILFGKGHACGHAKGLSARPLETFGVALDTMGACDGVALGT